MPRRNGNLTKSQMDKFASLMANFGIDQESAIEVTKKPLYSETEVILEGQSIILFFQSRVEPLLEAGEKVEDFDKRFKAWKFKECEGCHQRFAYAYPYGGVRYCSLDCLEKGLADIGIRFSRHQDVKRRWGLSRPAVVPASALQALSDIYGEKTPAAFEP
jgi:hypothetical protein